MALHAAEGFEVVECCSNAAAVTEGETSLEACPIYIITEIIDSVMSMTLLV
jgi:hypothetical protein